VPTDITLSNIGATEIKLRENRIEANQHRFENGFTRCMFTIRQDRLKSYQLLVTN